MARGNRFSSPPITLQSARTHMVSRGETPRSIDAFMSELRTELFGSGASLSIVPTFILGDAPHGKTLMAGAGRNMTHFWDPDDGWQKIEPAMGNYTAN